MIRTIYRIAVAYLISIAVVYGGVPFSFWNNQSGHSSKLPNQVTGLMAWYPFNTIAGSDGNAQIAFVDASGTANNLAGTATLKTGVNGKNSLNVLLFDGSSNEFVCASLVSSPSQPYSMFIVFQALSATSGPVVLKWGTGCELQIDNGGSFWDPQCGNGTDRTIGTADTNWHIMGFVYNGASSVYRIDGGAWTTFPSNPGTGAMTSITLGSAGTTAYLNMKWGESAFYSVGVTTTGGDGDALFNGLNSKWAVY